MAGRKRARLRKTNGEEKGLQKLVIGRTLAVAPHPLAEDVEGVLRSILLLMPIQKVMEFRDVNRLWRSLLSSPSFVKEWERQKHSRPGWVVMQRKVVGSVKAEGMELVAYDDMEGSWTNLSRLMKDGRNYSGGDSTSADYTLDDRRTRLVEGSSEVPGLLCLIVKRKTDKRLCVLVLNPMTGFHNLVPMPSCVTVDEKYVGERRDVALYLRPITSDTNPRQQSQQRHYRIFLLHARYYDVFDFHAHVFDSRFQSWQSHDVFEFEYYSIHTARRSFSLLRNADVVFTFPGLQEKGMPILTYRSYPNGLHDFELVLLPTVDDGNGGSSYVHIQGNFHVFRHGGRMFVAMAVGEHVPNKDFEFDLGFRVYELKMIGDDAAPARSALEWLSISGTPEHLRIPLPFAPAYADVEAFVGLMKSKHSGFEFRFVSADGLVCMTLIGRHGNHDCTSLVYDMGSGSWRRLPLPPSTGNRCYRIRPLCAMRAPLLFSEELVDASLSCDE